MTLGSPKFKYYAVSKGKQPGIYDNWHEADKQVTGVSGACHKGFTSERQAEAFMRAAEIPSPKRYFRHPTSASPANIPNMSMSSSIDIDELEEATITTSDTSSNHMSSTPIRAAAANTTCLAQSLNCEGCHKLTEMINQLSMRLTALEKAANTNIISDTTTNQRLEKIELSMQSLVKKVPNTKQPSAEHVDKIESVMNIQSASLKSYDFKFAEINAKLDSLTKHSPTKHSSNNRNQTPLPSANNQPAPEQQPTYHNTNNLQDRRPNKPNSTTTANLPSFKPHKCLVISSSNTNTEKGSFKHLNQDIIRRTLSTNHGPLLIDFINRYKFNSANPRFIIQLNSTEDAAKVLKDWKPESFGGSSVRTTIDPKENTTFIGMVKGVPRDIDDSELEAALKEQYPHATFNRLVKEGQPLRTLKLTFVSENQLKEAIAGALLLKPHNLMFRVEAPYGNPTISSINSNVN